MARSYLFGSAFSYGNITQITLHNSFHYFTEHSTPFAKSGSWESDHSISDELFTQVTDDPECVGDKSEMGDKFPTFHPFQATGKPIKAKTCALNYPLKIRLNCKRQADYLRKPLPTKVRPGAGRN